MRLIFAIMLIASSVLATEYTVIFIDSRIPADSVDRILKNIKEIGVDVGVIDKDTMRLWELKSDTNITGRVICARTDTLGVQEWKQLPLAQVETRVSKDVSPPDKQEVKVMTRAEFFADYEAVEERRNETTKITE